MMATLLWDGLWMAELHVRVRYHLISSEPPVTPPLPFLSACTRRLGAAPGPGQTRVRPLRCSPFHPLTRQRHRLPHRPHRRHCSLSPRGTLCPCCPCEGWNIESGSRETERRGGGNSRSPRQATSASQYNNTSPPEMVHLRLHIGGWHRGYFEEEEQAACSCLL